MILSSQEHTTSIWYNPETKEVSFSKPEVEADPGPSAIRPGPANGEDTLVEAARRIAEGVRPILFYAH